MVLALRRPAALQAGPRTRRFQPYFTPGRDGGSPLRVAFPFARVHRLAACRRVPEWESFPFMASVPSSGFDVAQLPERRRPPQDQRPGRQQRRPRFISFWRAAAIVLCDLASTAYYIGGISEQAIGKAAPWFILGVMLFSYAVRGRLCRELHHVHARRRLPVVKEAMGGSLAKLSVSALMFDYILTGPISAVSAGQYMVGLFVDMLNLINKHSGHPPSTPTHYQAHRSTSSPS